MHGMLTRRMMQEEGNRWRREFFLASQHPRATDLAEKWRRQYAKIMGWEMTHEVKVNLVSSTAKGLVRDFGQKAREDVMNSIGDFSEEVKKELDAEVLSDLERPAEG